MSSAPGKTADVKAEAQTVAPGSQSVTENLRDSIPNSFETTTVLTALYLWLIFGFLSPLVNCDLQRAIAHDPWTRHLISFLGFFFLFTVLAVDSKYSVLAVFIKSILVYILFMLATKSRIFFIVPVLLLLCLDQVLKTQIAHVKTVSPKSDTSKLEKARGVILYVVIALVIVGSIHYGIKQRRDHGPDFSWTTFFLGTGKCNMDPVSVSEPVPEPVKPMV
jgi:hypothetical protein